VQDDYHNIQSETATCTLRGRYVHRTFSDCGIFRLAFWGVHAVYAYQKNGAHELRVPRGLTDETEIYLV